MSAADYLALLAALAKRFDAAAKLIGFADAGFSARGDARTVNAARARERAVEMITAALGADTLNKLRSSGALLLRGQVGQLALA